MRQLLDKLKKETSCEKFISKRKGKWVNVGLVNQFARHDFIPNKWFDWDRRSKAEVMIIGQDWGPYEVLKSYVDDYELVKNNPNFNYDEFLFSRFSSRTERFILKVVKDTYEEKYENFDKGVYDNFFFTMAVLFTRKGAKFRGNENFDEKQSFNVSFPYVSRQIDIVSPKIIITLGNLAFKVINKKFNLGLEKKNLTQVIDSLKDANGVMKVGTMTIIPNYHPAAHIDPKIQKEIWRKIWQSYPL